MVRRGDNKGGSNSSSSTRMLLFGLVLLPSLVVSLSSSSSTTTSSSSGVTTTTPMQVMVTGAGGRTGQLVFQRLLEDPRYEPRGLVRSTESAKKLRRSTSCQLDQIAICDITTLQDNNKNNADDGSSSNSNSNLPDGLEGCEAMIICTSAVPEINKLALLSSFIKAPINLIRGKKAFDSRSMSFKWKQGQYPELVDYLGQKAQIDLAKRMNMKHVVIVSSMGGTDPGNFLNTIGKKPDGSGNGDILLWKRKAERYLTESGLSYTIIHPGGLVDTPAGEKDYVLDVDDKLLERTSRSISRGDVAALCVAALSVCEGKKISLDCITQDVEEGKKARTAEEALAAFIKAGKVYDYSK